MIELHEGVQPFHACSLDARFSASVLMPSPVKRPGPVPATVVVHGSLRTPEHFRDAFADYADATGSAIIAPLFPCGIPAPGDTESYKFAVNGGIRYDAILSQLVVDAAARHPGRLTVERFCLFGFSGGGQFVHRFAYLHPRKLVALSIGAPGKVTLLDDSLPWWRGTDGLPCADARGVDLDALRRVPLQYVIGADDDGASGVRTDRDSPHWMPGINDAGSDRMSLLRSFETSAREHGLPLRVDIVPDVAHDGFRLLEPVKHFFAEVLDREGDRAADEAVA